MILGIWVRGPNGIFKGITGKGTPRYWTGSWDLGGNLFWLPRGSRGQRLNGVVEATPAH